MLTETEIERLIDLDPEATIKDAFEIIPFQLNFMEREIIIKKNAERLLHEELTVVIEPIVKVKEAKQTIKDLYTGETYATAKEASEKTFFNVSKIQSDLSNIFSKGKIKPRFKTIKNN